MATLSDAQARDWYPAMLALARHLTYGHEQDAEDITQEAFAKVLRWQPPSLSCGLLCHLVKHAHYTRWRHESHHPWGAALPLVDWTPAHIEGPERASCIRETLAEVAALPWGDVLLAEAAGWSQATLAARHGTTRAALHMRFHRLRHGPLARLSPW
jgi:DNA-directed RNA polymerase specialized sigma24 family protein